MLNMNLYLSNPVADNIVVVNGAQFKVTDDVALKIMNLCLGRTEEVSQPVDKTPVAVTKSEKSESKQYGYSKKDLKVEYIIDKQTSVDGKTLFCISRGKSGWTTAEKNIINNAIKACDGIITIQVPYTGKNGTFKAWGYKTKKEALEMVEKLPKVFSKDDINKLVDEMNKGSR